jgi:hypothetical protein
MAELRGDLSGLLPCDGRELELVFRVVDRGLEPEWQRDRALYGPWLRYEAELVSCPVARDFGQTPWEAVHRLVSNHRAVLERRWSAEGRAP